MKILFYLPGTTTLWFNDNLVPLIRAAAREAEVHVIVPVQWNETGITENELAHCLDLDHVAWYILDGPDHPSYRTKPEAPEALLELVHEIGPDYTFVRGADVVTPMGFPGQVRFLMEGEYGPSLPESLPPGGRVWVTGPRFFDFGLMPDLRADQLDWLDRRIEPAWRMIAERRAPQADRAAYLAKVGLPTDRPIIALPLQYQGANNLFGQLHASEGPADTFVEQVAAALGEDVLIAVSIHPIDVRQRTGGPINRILTMDYKRVRVVDYPDPRHRGEATELLIRHADALVIAQSKSISTGTYFGKPILRLSEFETGDWVRHYADPQAFRAAVTSGTARGCDPDGMRHWYAWHFANNAFAAIDTDLADLIDRVDRPVNPERWDKALARHNLER